MILFSYTILIYNNTIEYLGKNEYKITGWYKNEQKGWECNYKNGRLHGKYMGWYENGQKSFERNYKNGELHKKYIGWHENGQKTYEYNYKNGRYLS